MKANISPRVITNTHNALIELNNLLLSGQYNLVRCNDILKTHKIHRGLMTYACRAEIFTRVSPGEYKSNVNRVDPIHARRCIELFYEMQRTNKSKKANKIIKTIPVNEAKEVKPAPAKPCLRRKAMEFKSKKVFKRVPPPVVDLGKSVSIFWGLFKIKF